MIFVPILNPQLQPVSQGVIGEIYISGIGLAIGYWKKGNLTKIDSIALKGYNKFPKYLISRFLNIKKNERRLHRSCGHLPSVQHEPTDQKKKR